MFLLKIEVSMSAIVTQVVCTNPWVEKIIQCEDWKCYCCSLAISYEIDFTEMMDKMRHFTSCRINRSLFLWSSNFYYSVTDQSVQTLPSSYLFPEATQTPGAFLPLHHALMLHRSLQASHAHVNTDAWLKIHTATDSSAAKQTVFHASEAAVWFHLEEECVKTTHPWWLAIFK